MHFPNPDETMLCPYCHSHCGFMQFGGDLSSGHVAPDGSRSTNGVRARNCRSCGGVVIEYRRQHGDDVRAVVYPVAPSRGLAPEEIREANADLADDYDEAVVCEPHSNQAAVILLARCATIILVDKCGAERKLALHAQIKTAADSGMISAKLKAILEGAHQPRNQVGHPWYDENGVLLKVGADDVDWWFEIIEWMFEELYITPLAIERRTERIQRTVKAKRAGDKA